MTIIDLDVKDENILSLFYDVCSWGHWALSTYKCDLIFIYFKDNLWLWGWGCFNGQITQQIMAQKYERWLVEMVGVAFVSPTLV
jgi:hypothetical protein